MINSHPHSAYHISSYRCDTSYFGDEYWEKERKGKGEGNGEAGGEEGLFTQPPSEKKQVIITVRNIASHTLLGSGFWYLLYRPLFFPNCPIPGRKGLVLCVLGLVLLVFILTLFSKTNNNLQ